MEENLDDLGYGSDLSDITPKWQFMKETIKLKNLSSVKELLRGGEEAQARRTFLQKTFLIKDCYPHMQRTVKSQQ